MRSRSAARGLRKAVLAALLIFGLGPVAMPVAAADFAAGVAAYDRGDYAAAYEAWLPLARAGDPAAQRNVGHLHRFGLGIAQDFERAAYWYREAAEAGLAAAQANLAVMYLRGQGVGEDPEEAAYWFRRAAVQGHAVAQYNLGLLHLSGNGVARSEAQAMGWFHLAAKSGHQQALEALSKLVFASANLVGPPTPPGWKPAAEKPAAAAAEPPETAAAAAGPDEVPSIDIVAAIARLFAKGDDEASAPAPAEKGDDTPGQKPSEGGQLELVGLADVPSVPTDYVQKPGDQRQLAEARVAFHAGDYEAARSRLQPLALAGMAEAQYWLGLLHGRPDFEAGDRAEAFVWLSLAADRGHPDAARARAGLMERMSSEDRLRSHTLLQARRGQS